MSSLLSPITDRLASFFFKAEPLQKGQAPSKRSNFFSLATTDFFTSARNKIISDSLSSCTLCKATLKKTKEGKISFYSKSAETIIFDDEKLMAEWLADEEIVDIWEIEDLREGEPRIFYKLQKMGAWGYDTFETEGALYDQLKADYGVFWKLVDQENGQTTYKLFKTGILGSHYEDVEYENLAYVANNLRSESGLNPPITTQRDTRRTSWGEKITACFLGSLLLSSGRSWNQNSHENIVPDGFTGLVERLGPAAFKADSAFQTSIQVAAGMVVGATMGGLPGAVLAGMIFLSEPVRGQSLCPQLVGNYDLPNSAFGIDVSGPRYNLVANDLAGLQAFDKNVTNPVLVGSHDTPGRAFAVISYGNSETSDDEAFVASESGGLWKFNVTDGTNITVLDSRATPGNAFGLALSPERNIVFTAVGLAGVCGYNLTNLALLGCCDTPGDAYDVVAFGNNTFGYFLLVADDVGGGVQAIGADNVTNMGIVGSYDTPGRPLGLVVFRHYLVVADGTPGILVLELNNLPLLTLVSSYNTGAYARSVTFFYNYFLVANWNGGALFLDANNITDLMFAGSCSTPGAAYDVAVSGPHVYIVDHIVGGLRICRTPCPTNSSLISTNPSLAPTNNGQSTAYISSFFSTYLPTLSSSNFPLTTTPTNLTAGSKIMSFENNESKLLLTMSIMIGVALVAMTGIGLIALLAYVYLRGRRKENQKEAQLDVLKIDSTGDSGPKNEKNFYFTLPPKQLISHTLLKDSNIPSESQYAYFQQDFTPGENSKEEENLAYVSLSDFKSFDSETNT